MYAGPEIVRRVGVPQRRNDMSKNVIPGHCGEPQLVSVWPQRGDDQEYGHSGEQKQAGAVIFFFVGKEQIEYDAGYVTEPHTIGNYKQFTEGNIVVYTHVNDILRIGHLCLQMPKPDPINDDIQDQRQGMMVFIPKYFAFFHNSSFVLMGHPKSCETITV